MKKTAGQEVQLKPTARRHPIIDDPEDAEWVRVKGEPRQDRTSFVQEWFFSYRRFRPMLSVPRNRRVTGHWVFGNSGGSSF